MKFSIMLLAVISACLAACVATKPKEIRDMTFNEYKRTLGIEDSPYATNAEFEAYKTWLEAGGYKKDPPRKPKIRSNTPSFGEMLALTSAALQFANTVNGRSSGYSGGYSAGRSARTSDSGGGWYPFRQHVGPGKGYFEINGRYYDHIVLKPGNGSLARPDGPPRAP